MGRYLTGGPEWAKFVGRYLVEHGVSSSKMEARLQNWYPWLPGALVEQGKDWEWFIGRILRGKKNEQKDRGNAKLVEYIVGHLVALGEMDTEEELLQAVVDLTKDWEEPSNKSLYVVEILKDGSAFGFKFGFGNLNHSQTVNRLQKMMKDAGYALGECVALFEIGDKAKTMEVEALCHHFCSQHLKLFPFLGEECFKVSTREEALGIVQRAMERAGLPFLKNVKEKFFAKKKVKPSRNLEAAE